jgi:NAD(P)-dependent dehydrogenase (short-subunit alcohol dehydrogenase family)
MATSSEAPIWFITGSSAGLGLALTRYAISQGHTVIASSRNPSRTPELVSEVEKSGGKWLALDTTQSEEEIKRTVQHAESLFGRLDILVNNAGMCVLGALEDIPDADTVYQMRVNFLGPLRVMQAVLPGMRRRRSGVIVSYTASVKSQSSIVEIGTNLTETLDEYLQRPGRRCRDHVRRVCCQ